MITILIVEDDLTRIKLFKKKLIGCIILIAYTAKTAIEILSLNKRFDYIFLDHDLGYNNGTGYDVAIWLTQHPKHKPKYIIVHSLNPVGSNNIVSLLPETIKYPRAWENIKLNRSI